MNRSAVARRLCCAYNTRTFGRAAALVRLIGPCANAGLLIEYKPVRTCDHIELSIDAVVEFIAHRFVLMAEVAIQARAVG